MSSCRAPWRLRLLAIACFAISTFFAVPHAQAATYHFDSVAGSDSNPGSHDKPFQSLAKVAGLDLGPGDTLRFKRGSTFAGGVTLTVSGEEDNPITFEAYGMGEMPRFSNRDYGENFGRVFDVEASYLVFQDLYFSDCSNQFEGRRRAQSLGAIFLNEGTHHNSISYCEFENMPVAIRDNGDYGVITHNYIHDFSEPLSRFWGPMGVVGTGNYTEIAYNTFINIRSVGTYWGADGGAIELDNHEHQEGIRVHHNYSRGNSGFLECYERGSYDDVVIAYNMSDDYEKFLGINGTSDWKVFNNTAIRTLHDRNGFSDFIWFREWYNPNEVDFANNIFITRDPGMPVYGDFREGLAQDGEAQLSRNNLYFTFNGDADVGKPLGKNDRVGDPLFVDFDNRNLHLRAGSAAIDTGADLGYTHDLDGTEITGKPDMGAYEFTGKPATEKLFNGRDLNGWTFFLDDANGAVDPADIWEVRDGVIWCSGETDGYARTKKKFRDFTLTLEWRWPETPGDSGVFVRMYEPDKRWPHSAEAQVTHQRAGDLYALGGSWDGVEAEGGAAIIERPGESVERPIGEWNHYEITCRYEVVELTINGQKVNRGDGNIPYQGYIGLQSAGAAVEFRNLELTYLD